MRWEILGLAEHRAAVARVAEVKYTNSHKSSIASAASAAPFNTRDDAERAIKRAKRWLKNQSRGKWDVPPTHIFANAELAARQFEDIATA